MKNDASTFDQWMNDPEIKTAYEEERPYFLLSELIHELMEEKGISVRKLAQETGLSANTIQKIKSGEATNVRFQNVFGVLKILGYQLVAEKAERRIVFTE
ncbi:MAG: helix-turn-helix transcriptional regulator [Cyclobacteriaceae bacterium]